MNPREPRPGSAVAFVSFLVVSIALGCKFYYWYGATDRSYFHFAHQFSPATLNHKLNDLLGLDWVLFGFLIVHILRTQLGILFAIYDPTFRIAVEESTSRGEPSPAGRRRSKRIACYCLWLFILMLLLTFLLTAIHFWWITIILGLQVVAFACFDYDNRRELLHTDPHKYTNAYIIYGDVVFGVLTVFLFSFGFCVVERAASEPLPETFVRIFGLVAYGALVVVLSNFIIEAFWTYPESVGAAARAFWYNIVPWKTQEGRIRDVD